MTRSMKGTLVLVAIACLTSVLTLLPAAPVRASDYYNGYTSSSGYVWRDGYWWANGCSYYRVKEWYYDYCGCKRWRWRYYSAGHVSNSYARSSTITYNDVETGGWRDKLLDIAKQRDQYESVARKSALEHAEFVESVRLLGMEGNFRWNGYGYEPAYAQGGVPYPGGVAQSYGSLGYSQLPTQQGSTIYGYKEVADIYGNVDLGALYNSVMRLRSQSYDNEAKATSETHALVGTLGESMSRAAEIKAKGQAAAAALSASGAQDRATLLREFWSTYDKKSAIDSARTQAATTTDLASNLTALVQAKCVSCHNGDKQNGGLNLADLSQVTVDQGGKILERIVDPDPARRMPLGPDNKPGTALTAAEVALFYLAAYAGGGESAKQD